MNMRWFWLWRLHVWNIRLRDALDDLPDNWSEHPTEFAEEIMVWARAHCKVQDLLFILDKKA
jgi:hypothetical protein